MVKDGAPYKVPEIYRVEGAGIHLHDLTELRLTKLFSSSLGMAENG